MVTIKKPSEVKLIKEGGKKLSRILREVIKFARVGVTTEEIDKLAEKLIYEAGGESAFRGYKVPGSPPFPSVICISINNEVVHAPAIPLRTLKDGDVVGLDIGMRYPSLNPKSKTPKQTLRDATGHVRNPKQVLNPKSEILNLRGLYTDMAATIGIGKVGREARELLKVTREALFRGLKVIKPGNLITDIGREVEKYVGKFGYGIVRDLVGHGVGHEIHEEPPIPNYFDARMPKIPIQEGMVLAIEPMITLGKGDVKVMPDKWTVVTHDGSLAAHFEVTVVVTKKGCEVATPLPKLT